jgi:hypothetical protein
MIIFLDQYRLAIARPRGLFDAPRLQQLLAALRALERVETRPFDRLLDLSLIANVRISTDELFEIAQARRRETLDRAAYRVAILAPDPLCFGLARMYGLMLENSPVRVHVCGSPDSAADWLQVPVEIVQPRLVSSLR